MRRLNETFEDGEFEALLLAKDGMTWHDFILSLIPTIESEVKVEEIDG